MRRRNAGGTAILSRAYTRTGYSLIIMAVRTLMAGKNFSTHQTILAQDADYSRLLSCNEAEAEMLSLGDDTRAVAACSK